MESKNRQQRRHPERPQGAVQPPERPQSSQHDLTTARNPDVQNVRAKPSGHGKKTADKWNQ